MADTTTTTYGLTKPEVGASDDTWGTKLNTDLDLIDDLLDGTTAIAPNLSTLTIAGTAVTSTAAELNYSDGVTSNIQTQLDSKAPIASPTFTGTVTATEVDMTYYTESVFSVTGTTPSLSPSDGSIQTWTLSGNSTPTAGTWDAGQSITLMIDDGSAYAVTWTTLAVNWKTDGGDPPSLNTAGFTVIVLWKVGSTIYGARVGDA